MDIRRLLILSLFAALSCVVGRAEEPIKAELTLEKAIEIALSDNPTIKIANLEVDRQEYVRKETRGHLLPTVSATGTYTRTIVKSEMGKGMSFDPDNMVSAGATLTLPLFAPSVYKTLRMNEQQMRAAVEEARASRVILVNEVKKAFYNILLAKRSLEVLGVSENNLQQTVDEIEHKFKNEIASEYDLITAQVQLSNLQPTILQTKNSIEVAYKLLKMYLSLPSDLPLEVVGNLDDFADEAKSAQLGERSLSYNTELKAMEIQIGLLEQQLKVQKTVRMPTLAAFAEFQVSGRDPLDMSSLMGGGDYAEPFMGEMKWKGSDGTTGSWTGSGSWRSTMVIPKGSSSFMWTNPFHVGVTISIPIFSGLTNTYKERQIKNSLSQLRMQRDYIEENIGVELENAINDILTSAAMVNANALTIEQAEKGYQISKTRYDAGMGTMLEMNSAELQLTQAKLNHTQAIYDFLSAQADYERILGREE